MNSKKRKKLEARGWHLGTTQEFLGLSKSESAHIESKLTAEEKSKSSKVQNKNSKPTQ